MKHIVYPALSILFLFLGCGSPDTQTDTNIEVPVSVEEITRGKTSEFYFKPIEIDKRHKKRRKLI